LHRNLSVGGPISNACHLTTREASSTWPDDKDEGYPEIRFARI
jgi:hypothetical protein